jgi:hypothetical protein
VVGAGQRQPDVGAAPCVGGAGLAAVGAGDGLDECEAVAGAAVAGAGRAAEALECARQVVVGEAGAVVDDVQLDPLAPGAGGDSIGSAP